MRYLSFLYIVFSVIFRKYGAKPTPLLVPIVTLGTVVTSVKYVEIKLG